MKPYNLNVEVIELEEGNPLRMLPEYSELLTYVQNLVSGERNVTVNGHFEEGHIRSNKETIEAKLVFDPELISEIKKVNKILSGETDNGQNASLEIVYGGIAGEVDYITLAEKDGLRMHLGLK
jgi:hypothetical protein